MLEIYSILKYIGKRKLRGIFSLKAKSESQSAVLAGATAGLEMIDSIKLDRQLTNRCYRLSGQTAGGKVLREKCAKNLTCSLECGK